MTSSLPSHCVACPEPLESNKGDRGHRAAILRGTRQLQTDDVADLLGVTDL